MKRPVGEVPGEDMREDKAAYDDPAILETINKNLSEVKGLEVESVDESTPVESDDTADDSDSTPPRPTAKTKKAAEEDEPTPDDSDEEPADEEAEEKDKPAIPDNHYRAAVHQGWKPEEIQELYDANPELALKTLKKLHEDTNKVSQVFAQKGRLVAQERQNQNQQPPAQSATVQTPPVNMESLKAKYDDDPFGAIADLIKATVGQQQQVVQSQPQQIPQPVDQQAAFREQLAAYNDVVNFFKDKDMADYEDLYGVDERNLTPGQAANRQAVTDMADAIIDGMNLEGRKISNTDALMRAHLIVSAPVAEKIVRNRIVKEVKKREKGMTLRPSKSKSPVPKSTKGVKSDNQLVTDTQARLNNMRW